MKNKSYVAYIDEFGNTGDAVIFNQDHPWGDQPVFCLSAVVLEDENTDLNNFLDTIRPNSSEIKSKNMFPKWTPEAVRIFDKITKSDCKVLIELVDKKYQVCSFIVNQFFLPPTECSFDLESWKIVAKTFADKLYWNMPKEIYDEYYKLAKNCTEETVLSFFKRLLKMVDSFGDDDIFKNMIEALKETEDSFINKLPSIQNSEDFFLKDLNVSGKELYLVPNLLAFSNIYCRLCGLPIDVSIVHDNQTQFGHIMQSHKDFLVKNHSLLPNLKNVGWTPLKIRDLAFELKDSKSARFIQIADVISGFIGRIHLKYMNGETLNESEKELVSIVQKSMLLNYVGPHSLGNLWMH